MSELFEKSIRTLELPAVLELLAAQAVSDEARDRARKLAVTDYEEVCHLQDETEAAPDVRPPRKPQFSGLAGGGDFGPGGPGRRPQYPGTAEPGWRPPVCPAGEGVLQR